MTNSEHRMKLREARRAYRIAGSGNRTHAWKGLKLTMMETLRAELDRAAN